MHHTAVKRKDNIWIHIAKDFGNTINQVGDVVALP